MMNFHWSVAARRGESRGRPVKMGERLKMFALSDIHYFFRQIFYLLRQIVRRGTSWRPFFCSPSWFFRFSGGFSGNFRQKMTLPTFGSNPEKRKKPTLKWAKICQIFKSKGVTSSWSRRHCRERQHLEVKQTYVLTQFSHHIEYYSFRQNLLFKSRKWEQKFIDMSL